MLIEDDFSTKENEATAPVEVEIIGHGEAFKEELVPLKIGGVLKTEPTFRIQERTQQRNRASNNGETTKKNPPN